MKNRAIEPSGQRKNQPLKRALAIVAVAIGMSWGATAQAQQPEAAANKQSHVATNTAPAGGASDAATTKGNGTTNFIPVWTSSSTIGNSIMSQSSGGVNVSGGLAASGAVSAASVSGNGSGLVNVNAATLGGVGPSSFAQVGATNTFNADQTINGNLGLFGSINKALTLQGSIVDSNGSIGANVIGGFGGNNNVPGNSVASGILGATIAGGGGFINTVFSQPAPNSVSGDWSTVGGGAGNVAGGKWATVTGGLANQTGNDWAPVGGGQANFASGVGGTVAGGFENVASGLYTAVPGGTSNTAAGGTSFAAGFLATAKSDGSFVWSDVTNGGLTDAGPNSFSARASGGFVFLTAPGTSTGATLVAGSGSWSTLSDRNVKAHFTAVDGQALLTRLAALPIATWNYKAQPDSVRHIGPTAQDFREAFGLGEDERHISTVDAQGVALAAIQALYDSVTELKRDLGYKDRQIVDLLGRLAQLEQRP